MKRAMSGPETLVGVVGAARGSAALNETAGEVGRLIARRGWVLVTGGMSGVMHHASRGAREEGGVVVGILPTPSREGMNPFVTIPIVTAMGHARNVIIAHTSEALIALGGGYGTVSEMAIALKLGKPVISLGAPVALDGVRVAAGPGDAVEMVASMLRANR